MATSILAATAIRTSIAILMSIPTLTLTLIDTGICNTVTPIATHMLTSMVTFTSMITTQTTDTTSCISRMQRTIMATTIKRSNHIHTSIDLPGSGKDWASNE